MATYEMADNVSCTTEASLGNPADGLMSEVFADWRHSTSGRTPSYAGEGRSSTTALDQFGALEIFDSSNSRSAIYQPDDAAQITSPAYRIPESSADISLDAIEFANSSSIPSNNVGAAPDVRATGENQDIEQLFNDNFDRLDKNGDGYIGQHEVDRAMTNPNFTGEDAALVAMLKDMQLELQKLSNDEWFEENDGVTKADMAAFAKLQQKDDKSQSEEQMVGAVEGLFASGNERMDGNRRLFADKDNPLESITPEAVLQGRINDCPFMADLGALADTPEGKEAIKNMIHVNDDGSYTVTFPGDPDHPITVTSPTDAELAYYAGGSECGTWAAVLEKAYGKYCDSTNVVPQDGVPSGSPIPGFELLTGKTVDKDIIDETSTEQTARKMKEAIEDGRPVTVVSRRADQLSSDSGIEPSHAYSVVGYDPETGTIQLRNPWGDGEPLDADGKPADGKNDGVFTMTLEEFEKHFNRALYVEE